MFTLLLLMIWIATTYASGHCLPINKGKFEHLFKSGACKTLPESKCIVNPDCNWFIQYGGIVFAADRRSQETLSYEPRKTRQQAPIKGATTGKTMKKPFPFGITRINVKEKTKIDFIPMFSTITKTIKSHPGISKELHAEHQLKVSSITKKSKHIAPKKSGVSLIKHTNLIEHNPLIRPPATKVGARRRLFLGGDRREGLTDRDIAGYGKYNAIGGIFEYGYERMGGSVITRGEREWRDEGSGFLVGKKWVVTAAHVLWNGVRAYDVDYYGFFPGYTGGGNVRRENEGELGNNMRPTDDWEHYQYKFKTIYFPAQWQHVIKQGRDDENEWQYDWAVVELENEVNIDEDNLFEMKGMIRLDHEEWGIKLQEDDERVWKAGYPMEWLFNMVSTKEQKSIFGKFAWKRELLYFKDAISQGESGGPIVYNDDVYGIQRGYTPDKQYTVGVGLSLAKRVTICHITGFTAKGCRDTGRAPLAIESHKVNHDMMDEFYSDVEHESDIESELESAGLGDDLPGAVGSALKLIGTGKEAPSTDSHMAYYNMDEYDEGHSREDSYLFASDIYVGMDTEYLLFVINIVMILIFCCLFMIIAYICGVGIGYVASDIIATGHVSNGEKKKEHIDNIDSDTEANMI